MVFSAYLLENTNLVLSQDREFVLYFWAPPWGICSFSKTKWQMPGGGGMGTLGIVWAIMKKKSCSRWNSILQFLQIKLEGICLACGEISSKTILNSFSVWNHSVKKKNNNKKLNSVLSFGNAWRWKIDETVKKVFFVTKLIINNS